MKYVLTSILIYIFSWSLYASELSCSANGAMVLHFPGAFTSGKKQFLANDEIAKILENNESRFDLKMQESNYVPISSQGLIQDKLTYFRNSFGTSKKADMAWFAVGAIETSMSLSTVIKKAPSSIGNLYKFGSSFFKGTKSNFKIANVSRAKKELELVTAAAGTGASGISGAMNSTNIYEALVSQENSHGGDRILKVLSVLPGFFGDPIAAANGLNMVSLGLLEGEFNTNFIDQQRDSLLSSRYSTDLNIARIQNKILEELNANKKVILSAHGEGNQLALRAINNIRNDGTQEQKEKLSKVLAVLSTSPTTSGYSDKYRYMKNNYDQRIGGGTSVATNYVFKSSYNPESFKDYASLAFNALTKNRLKSDFVEDYLNEVKIARSDIGIESTMRVHYIDELRKSALTLEDNCEGPEIKLSSTEASVDPLFPNQLALTGFSSPGRKVLFKVQDLNDLGEQKTTVFNWEYQSFSMPAFLENKKYNYPEGYLPFLTDEIFEGTETSVDTPFNDLSLSIKVESMNKDGKISSKTFTIVNYNNRAPVIKDFKQACVSNNGAPSTVTGATFTVDDDSLATYALKEIGHNFEYADSPGKTVGPYKDLNNLQSGTEEITNQCSSDHSPGSATIKCINGVPGIVVSGGKTGPNGGVVYMTTDSGSGMVYQNVQGTYDFIYMLANGTFPSGPKSFNVEFRDNWTRDTTIMSVTGNRCDL